MKQSIKVTKGHNYLAPGANPNHLQYAGSSYPYTIEVSIKLFNPYTYKYGEYAGIVQNVLSMGGTLCIVNEYYNKVLLEYKVEDTALVDMYKTMEAGRQLMGRRIMVKGKEVYEYPKGKASQITGYWGAFLRETFHDRETAVTFYAGEAWNERILPALPSKRDIFSKEFEEKLFAVYSNETVYKFRKGEYKRKALLDTFIAQNNLRYEEVYKAELPNMDVSAPMSFIPEFEWYDKFKNVGKFQPSTNDELEKRIVNAWYYKRQDFRVPTLAEQESELVQLQAWFAKVQASMKAPNLTVVDWIVSPEVLDKHARLLQLEAEVSFYTLPVLNPDWVDDRTEEEETLEYFFDAVNAEEVVDLDAEDEVEDEIE